MNFSNQSNGLWTERWNGMVVRKVHTTWCNEPCAENAEMVIVQSTMWQQIDH